MIHCTVYKTYARSFESTKCANQLVVTILGYRAIQTQRTGHSGVTHQSELWTTQ